MTTVPPAVETAAPATQDMLFPHFADGGGFTTQFILFNATAGQVASGALRLYDPSGHPLSLIP